MREKGEVHPELEDKKWFAKLMFLAAMTTHDNELKLCLQGPGKTVINQYETWKDFVSKLDVYKHDVQTAIFCYFKHLKNLSFIVKLIPLKLMNICVI